MNIVGHFEDGKVVFDSPPPFADGTPVTVDAIKQPGIDSEPRDMPVEEWIAMLRQIAADQPVCDWYVDVSRDSIYD